MAEKSEKETTEGEDARAVLLVHSMQNGQLPLREAFLSYDWKVYEVRSASEAIAFLQERPLPIALVERVEDWMALASATELLGHPPCLIVTSRLGDRKVWGDVLELAATMFSLLRPEARK